MPFRKVQKPTFAEDCMKIATKKVRYHSRTLTVHLITVIKEKLCNYLSRDMAESVNAEAQTVE